MPNDRQFREIRGKATCPVCGHCDRCKYAVELPDDLRLCFRVSESDINGFRRIKQTRGCATYIRTGSELDRRGGTNGRATGSRKPTKPRSPSEPPASPRHADLDHLAEKFAEAVTNDQVDDLARELGVSPESLRAIGIGHDGANISFPERDASGKVTAINTRLANGEKRVGTGQRRGLIVPNNLAELPDPVLIPEGHSDTAALFTMGLTAVGRPMAKGGTAELAELLAGREVLVVGENDDAGIKGAKYTASRLAEAWNMPVAWALPPKTAKDSREYLIAHASESPEVAGRELLAHLRAHQQFEDPDNIEPAVPAWRPFPTDVLPEPLRKYVTVTASALGCDESFVAVPLLASCAGAIGNSRGVMLKRSWYEPPILWATVVAESGTMKSPGQDHALKFLRHRQERMFKAYADALAEYKRKRADYKRARKAAERDGGNPPAEPTEPICPRCRISDVTIEALAVTHLENPRGLTLDRDELSAWFGSFNQYRKGQGADVANWLEIHGGRSITIDRKTVTPGAPRRIHVPRASVSICGTIQPDIFRRHLRKPEFLESGLVARLLLAIPPRRAKCWTENDIPEALEQTMQTLFDRLFDLQPESDELNNPRPRLVRLAPSAKALWISFYNEQAGEQAELSGDLAAAWSKLEGYAARLALVVHLVRWATGDRSIVADQFDAESMRSGIALSRWFAHEARRAYGMLSESEEDRGQRQLVDLIRLRGGRITTRELMRASREYRRDADSAETALNELARTRLGTWSVDNHGGGRGQPKRVFVLGDTGDGNTNAKNNGKS